MVNALHHPPEGALPKGADDLVCNTRQQRQREGERERERGERKGERWREGTEELDMWGREHGYIYIMF